MLPGPDSDCRCWLMSGLPHTLLTAMASKAASTLSAGALISICRLGPNRALSPLLLLFARCFCCRAMTATGNTTVTRNAHSVSDVDCLAIDSVETIVGYVSTVTIYCESWMRSPSRSVAGIDLLPCHQCCMCADLEVAAERCCRLPTTARGCRRKNRAGLTRSVWRVVGG